MYHCTEQNGKMAEVQALIMYGNGLQALYYDEKSPEPDRDGVMVIPMLVAPSDEIITKYDLTEEQDLTLKMEDGKKAMWVSYPVKQVKWLNRSKTGAVIWIWCAFNRARTPIMGYMDELLEWDTQRDKTENRLRARISTLEREQEDLLSNLTETLRNLKELQDITEKKEESEEEV